VTASEVLVRAFFTDPAVSWAVRDPDARRAMEPWYAGIIRLGEKYGHVDTLEGRPPRSG